jgi:dolichol kinase
MENPTKERANSLSLKGEFYRKTIHFFSSAIPIGYYFIPKNTVLAILFPLLFLMLLTEALKYKSDFIYHLYLKYFKSMLRDHETDRGKIRINGASWVFAADILVIIIFPKYIAITGMLLLSFSDSLSAIFGRLYGKKYYAPNRSFAGTLTFFIVGVLIVFFTPKYLYVPVEYYIALFAVLVTTVADSVNLPVDDNFVIPIVYSGFLYVLYLIFLPSVFVN